MTDASYFFPGQLFQNPDGTFSLNVTGQLESKGLSIQEALTSALSQGQAIAWTDTGAPAGVVHEWIQGAVNLEVRTLRLLTVTDAGHQVFIDLAHDRKSDHTELTLTAMGVSGTAQFLVGADDGTSGFLQKPLTVTQPALAPSTIRQPNALHPTLVCVMHDFTCSAGQTESYQILIGSVSPPAIVVDEPFLAVAAGGVNVQSVNSSCFIVPQGWYYRILQLQHFGIAGFLVTEWTL